MDTNMGQVDRIIRVVIGIIVIVLGVINQNWLGAIGLIPLITPQASVSARCTRFWASKPAVTAERNTCDQRICARSSWGFLLQNRAL
ncbi:hypothetical protein Clim_1214 [Chlorobium limicola DSM 245]|uniref:Inner membrane protein YgaP-like transmembrane domain-containing protein n=2 Tax=Chlorobium limicola TaxID=1092 RepID=B3ECK6_CHLL2|nr:YgaP-like transmembrane domain [Chlorobium limicola]ACD90281.1 hypothetical protein Clim_1214 [Chlorobium limicola DSM 245]